MSVDVYKLEERVSYQANEPTSYFGWRVSASSESASATPFRTADQRAEFVEHVGGQVARLTTQEREHVAAFAALLLRGGDERAYDLGDELLNGWDAINARELDAVRDTAAAWLNERGL